jgi:hypothetical protein
LTLIDNLVYGLDNLIVYLSAGRAHDVSEPIGQQRVR